MAEIEEIRESPEKDKQNYHMTFFLSFFFLSVVLFFGHKRIASEKTYVLARVFETENKILNKQYKKKTDRRVSDAFVVSVWL